MDFSSIIDCLNKVAQSPFFGCIILMIAVGVLYRWANKAWVTLTQITKDNQDTMIKTSVVMQRVLDVLDKK